MPKVIRFAGLLLVAGLTSGPATADEKKPNTLTPKEIADGWLMLFDGETTFGWKVDGEATVKDGKLVIGGTKPTTLTSTASFPRLQYLFAMDTADGKALTGGGLYLSQKKEPKLDFTSVINVGRAFGHEYQDHTGEHSPVRIVVPAGRAILVSKLLVRPIELDPLFNGKDLSGWKVFNDPKRNRSKFEVTPAGELHLTNGLGDLQTEGKYADFVLQLECKTNDINLNSGIFFRCMPDQYQNGYEAQIHNGYKDKDRTKPTDFGTGAIYRRVAARKVVANDKEWFTLTVIANGPHIATWVNGYQTADWTDDRKPADNPRQGLRTAAGHISIQGHDPTTDILFRNIRIAELKRE